VRLKRADSTTEQRPRDPITRAFRLDAVCVCSSIVRICTICQPAQPRFNNGLIFPLPYAASEIPYTLTLSGLDLKLHLPRVRSAQHFVIMPALASFDASASAPSNPDFPSRVPALAHTLARTVFPRAGFQFKSGSAATNFSKNAIAYIVCLGFVPLIIVTCVVIWALCYYGRNRKCCPCCAKRKDTDEQELVNRRGRDSANGSDVSEDIVMKELRTQRMGMHYPTRQSVRPLTAVREDSGLASILGQGHEKRAPSLRAFV
jgi:hypothetical protein